VRKHFVGVAAIAEFCPVYRAGLIESGITRALLGWVFCDRLFRNWPLIVGPGRCWRAYPAAQKG